MSNCNGLRDMQTDLETIESNLTQLKIAHDDTKKKFDDDLHSLDH